MKPSASLARLLVTLILLILAILLSACGGHTLAGADRHPYGDFGADGANDGVSAPMYDDAW